MLQLESSFLHYKVPHGAFKVIHTVFLRHEVWMEEEPGSRVTPPLGLHLHGVEGAPRLVARCTFPKKAILARRQLSTRPLKRKGQLPAISTEPHVMHEVLPCPPGSSKIIPIPDFMQIPPSRSAARRPI